VIVDWFIRGLYLDIDGPAVKEPALSEGDDDDSE
jgi:hypothetical protein